MTATVSPPVGIHWRAINYDVYTGRGWARSEERLEPYAANEPLPLPTFEPQIEVNQEVNWLLDTRRARYSVGEPLQFDQEVSTAWRGVDDLVRVNGDSRRYTVTSRHTPAGAVALRQVSTADAPAALLARYTALPDSIPERVLDLGAEITAGQTNAYDQAVSIEQFLRQYPYDLNVTGPPAGQDPVDYFLFDLQRGYCDYYGSAMVILARAVGLPARLAIGYLSQLPDDQGVQTVYHINAHSWAEVYFAGHGWVEFEPTAAFPTQEERRQAITGSSIAGEPPEAPPPPIPEPAAQTINPLWALPLILLLVAAFYLFSRFLDRSRPEGQTIWQAYSQLQRAAAELETVTQATQTPAEFETTLLSRVDQLAEHPRPEKWLAETRPGIQAIARAYAARRYSRQKEDPVADRRLWQTWLRMRRAFWLSGRWLTLHRWLNRPGE
jgi:transglutaminase-like putative cysteine protease